MIVIDFVINIIYCIIKINNFIYSSKFNVKKKEKKNKIKYS